MTTATMPNLRLRIPPLQNGDHLDAREFHRRYKAMPHVKKAELINGVVYMSSPVNADWHATPHYNLVGWTSYYTTHTPGLIGADNATLKINKKNTPQPDVGIYIKPELGGKVEKTKKGYLARCIEFIAEVSASSVNYDSHEKFETYRKAAIQEYMIWRVEDGAIDWWQLVDGKYKPLAPDEAGIVRSVIFPGLWLDTKAMLKWDVKTVLDTLQKGVTSQQHTDFVSKLQKV